jgi:hypothetical protein
MMEKKFIIKLITNCFSQYEYERDLLDVNVEDLEEMYIEVLKEKEEEPASSLHDIVNDVVYEYLTK